MPRFQDIRQITMAKYHVDIGWDYLEKWIDAHDIDMDPDFQRGYVWNQNQKEQYIEWVLRNGNSGRDIYFNHPGWFREWEGQMVIVDGKQRVEAVLGFLHDEVKAYGHYKSEYTDRMRMVTSGFSVYVADLKSREEVLQWYLDMNTGGTIHTDEEVNKVKELLRVEKTKNLENDSSRKTKT